jgi:hypothetical protein
MILSRFIRTCLPAQIYWPALKMSQLLGKLCSRGGAGLGGSTGKQGHEGATEQRLQGSRVEMYLEGEAGRQRRYAVAQRRWNCSNRRCWGCKCLAAGVSGPGGAAGRRHVAGAARRRRGAADCCSRVDVNNLSVSFAY